ncbi:MAG: (d)CMP kinase [Phycisphaerae bacterium]|nr:(d)CMP kinase [Phycisphaerae bacterium]
MKVVEHTRRPIRVEPPVSRLIVTIDGPAGTGKSSVARALAGRLGLDFLDTGAMYRAAAAIVIDHGLDRLDESAVVEAVDRAGLHFDWTTDPPTLRSEGRSCMERLRESDVTSIVSPVAGLPRLRELLVLQQRRIGREHPRLVTEGRDQGSVVFPDAEVKFYLDASPAVRAVRRAEQLRGMGHPADPARLEAEIRARDRSDSSRTVGPLVRPAGAIVVDTSNMTFDGVVAELERLVRSRLAAAS